MYPVATVLVLFVESKCPSKVSERKWASIQTTLCEGTYTDTMGITTYGTGLQARHEFRGQRAPFPSLRA